MNKLSLRLRKLTLRDRGNLTSLNHRHRIPTVICSRKVRVTVEPRSRQDRLSLRQGSPPAAMGSMPGILRTGKSQWNNDQAVTSFPQNNIPMVGEKEKTREITRLTSATLMLGVLKAKSSLLLHCLIVAN